MALGMRVALLCVFSEIMLDCLFCFWKVSLEKGGLRFFVFYEGDFVFLYGVGQD